MPEVAHTFLRSRLRQDGGRPAHASGRTPILAWDRGAGARHRRPDAPSLYQQRPAYTPYVLNYFSMLYAVDGGVRYIWL